MNQNKSVDVKVRINEKDNEFLNKKAKELSMSKAKLIRNGVDQILKLLEGIDDEKLEVYEINYNLLNEKVNKFISNKITFSNIEEFKKINEVKDKLIKDISICLDTLYGLAETTRDEILTSMNQSYNELFKKGITVSMPISTKLFKLQKEYFELLKKLYNYNSLIEYK